MFALVSVREDFTPDRASSSVTVWAFGENVDELKKIMAIAKVAAKAAGAQIDRLDGAYQYPWPEGLRAEFAMPMDDQGVAEVYKKVMLSFGVCDLDGDDDELFFFIAPVSHLSPRTPTREEEAVVEAIRARTAAEDENHRWGRPEFDNRTRRRRRAEGQDE